MWSLRSTSAQPTVGLDTSSQTHPKIISMYFKNGEEDKELLTARHQQLFFWLRKVSCTNLDMQQWRRTASKQCHIRIVTSCCILRNLNCCFIRKRQVSLFSCTYNFSGIYLAFPGRQIETERETFRQTNNVTFDIQFWSLEMRKTVKCWWLRSNTCSCNNKDFVTLWTRNRVARSRFFLYTGIYAFVTLNLNVMPMLD